MSRIEQAGKALVALLAVVVLTAGAADARGKKKHSDKATVGHHYQGLDAALARYEPEDRAEWQLPGKVLLMLALAEGETVADLGTGTGFMVPVLSGAVGEMGRVLAVDLERELVEYAAARPESPYATDPP